MQTEEILNTADSKLEKINALLAKFGKQPAVVLTRKLLVDLSNEVRTDSHPYYFYAVGKQFIEDAKAESSLDVMIDWARPGEQVDKGLVGHFIGAMIVRHTTLPQNSVAVFAYNKQFELGETRTVYLPTSDE